MFGSFEKDTCITYYSNKKQIIDVTNIRKY